MSNYSFFSDFFWGGGVVQNIYTIKNKEFKQENQETIYLIMFKGRDGW